MAKSPDLDLRARDRRDIVYHLRLSETEKTLLFRAAADAGVTVADYVREACRAAILLLRPDLVERVKSTRKKRST